MTPAPPDKPRTRTFRLTDATCAALDRVAAVLPGRNRSRTEAIRYLAGNAVILTAPKKTSKERRP